MNRIPKSFKLLGSTFKVKIDDKLCEREGAYALADYDKKVLILSGSSKGQPHSNGTMGHAFYHEICHFILNSMGQTKLNKDEAFVDMFGGLLHQALITMKYGKQTDKHTNTKG